MVCANTYYLNDTAYDERSFARRAALIAGSTLIEQEPDSAFDARLVLQMARTPSPSEFFLTLATNAPTLRLARNEKVDAIFYGAGGDEVFSMNALQYACTDDIYTNGIRAKTLGQVMQSAIRERTSFWRALARRISDGKIRDPLASMISRYGASAFLTDGAADEVVQSKRFLHPWILEAHGIPPGKIAQIIDISGPYSICPAGPFTEPHDPEAVSPLFSQPLMELCLRIPSTLLAQGGYSRGLVRRAFRDYVPDDLLWRTDKPGPELFVRHIVANNFRYIRERLLDGELVSQGIVDRERVDLALHGAFTKKFGHATQICYLYSTEVWLEAWRGEVVSSSAAA
jgi:asparagine synthase (glutamine-hydrolysing)